MQSDSEDEEMGKQERKMAKKLLKRIDGQMTLSKPQAELQNFQVKMTEPMSMMLVANGCGARLRTRTEWILPLIRDEYECGRQGPR